MLADDFRKLGDMAGQINAMGVACCCKDRSKQIKRLGIVSRAHGKPVQLCRMGSLFRKTAAAAIGSSDIDSVDDDKVRF